MPQLLPSALLLLLLLAVLSRIGQCQGNQSNDPALPNTTGEPAENTGFHDNKIVHDEAHLKEHLKEEIDTSKPMTPQEMEFHYFRLHDADNNTKLDGLEIMSALSHMSNMYDLTAAEKAGKSEQEVAELQRKRSDGATKHYADIVDKVLREDDFDHDGYISYPEYVSARRRDFDRYQHEMAQQQMLAQQMMQQQQAMAQQQQFQQFQQFQQQQQAMHMQQLQHQQQYQQPQQHQQQQHQGLPVNQGQMDTQKS
ncbi:putative cyclin-dependent serine/threonine-protein kinase DDB_G0272797/DDB_G0274007 [Ylistrum balloti]|uniref:putative cyclin-dependent serine/threonine-protein kinase DDB_G0272797/DDB_G0274007 n=1 Tax=Ylistrum balloti TaxID=509963 RepID=UPI002905A236|nr:putative cyclin-dependent serine/threonine-protein kinase DDB_G0272797/DDB_G0274007 [Ylistrum balloti]